MPTKSKFSPYYLSAEKRKRLKIAKFLGVDYNEAQLEVADYHAVEMENFVYKDKVNQKRDGWEKLLKIEPTTYNVVENGTSVQKTNTTNVNAIWNFIGADNKEHIVAHIGKLLYEIKGVGKDKTFFDISITPLLGDSNIGIELEDYKSSAFYGYKKLYILGGNKFYVLSINNNSFSLEEVEDNENTYIPTTTIGITYADSVVNSVEALDDVNLMTQFRRNKLVSGTYIDDGVTLRTTEYWDYQLDSSVKAKNATDLNKIKITINSLKK